MATILPTNKVPDLTVDLIDGKQWSLGDQSPNSMTMLVFYRGYHCPKCQEQLEDLETKMDDFRALGVNVLAVSMDKKERAQQTYDEWDIDGVPLGYGLSEKTARAWGLFMSQKMEKDASKTQEPLIFSEPGLFLVNPDSTLYSSSIQTMPFARPQFSDVIAAIQFINKNKYPPRGGE